MPIILSSQLDRLERHEIPPDYDEDQLDGFIEFAKQSGGAELANAQAIFLELCQALHVPAPSLKKASGDNAYCFEEDVKAADRAHRRIDVYNRGHFIFEAKQGVDPHAPQDELARTLAKSRTGHSKTVRGAGRRGSTDWIEAMRDGRYQAGRYAVHVAQRGDPKPPFLIVADVGYCLWIWSSFSADQRDDYGDFEAGAAFSWDDLARPEVFAFLRQIWVEPALLNEEARGQRVTAQIADRVNQLAVRLEERFDPTQVGDFLMKCVFTMFAEDVDFLPTALFTQRLGTWTASAQSGHPEYFVGGLRALWTRMRDGGPLESGHPIRRFNGYLFRDTEPLPLQLDEMEALLLAAKANWRRVSPAIFGTLLERALSTTERQRLGAFYTPEAYIRRLVEQTLIKPLREQWTVARAEMELALRKGKKKGTATRKALARGHEFRHYLAGVKVLDPACGSGNFLYVALKEMKRLEGEAVRALHAAGDTQVWLDIPGETVHPNQFFGLEIKPWAAKIAELVLWIGYLQWQVSSNRMKQMPDPVIQDLHHIRQGDALIEWQGEEVVTDKQGHEVQVTRGVTQKRGRRHQHGLRRLTQVKVVKWPSADYVVGNPPFLGNKRLNDVLGQPYVNAIKEAFPEVPGTADLVMYWWARCADLVSQGKLKAFGLVTTNSITGKFNRAVVAAALEQKGLRLVYAIPDHPWFDEGAQVRIAMTVVNQPGAGQAVRGEVVDEEHTRVEELERVRVEEAVVPEIHADLSAGADIGQAQSLMANGRLCYQGVNLVGNGFRLDPEELRSLGYRPSRLPSVIKPYVIGRDLVQKFEEKYVIDFYGVEPDTARTSYPELWNRLTRLVWKERQTNNRESRRKNWWLFGEPVGRWRVACQGISRYIATSRTAKYRLFAFVPADTLPDTKVVAIALEDAAYLAILSSRVHVAWAMRAGGWLGVGNDSTYNHLECFGQFPFPAMSPHSDQAVELRRLGEALDKHRKAHPHLPLTDMYNVLEKLQMKPRPPLTDEEEAMRAGALIDTLLQFHNDIDHATLAAYGWPADLTDEQIIERLLVLNAERGTEEDREKVRWLRPERQAQATQAPLPEAPAPKKAPRKNQKEATGQPWPGDMPGRISALTALLREQVEPMPTAQISAAFHGASLEEVEMTLYCIAAADAVVKTQTESGDAAWATRA